jgi:hypothetical protein
MSRLNLVEGSGRGVCTGVEVFDELIALLDDRLPAVPLDDPVRQHLVAFHRAAVPLRAVAGIAARAKAPGADPPAPA